MTSFVDHYQVLGVLRDAEQIVITAAYRALASMYHPDRWKGDKDLATKRMADINVAYGVLCDPEKRDAYDKEHNSSTSSMGDEAESVDEAFDSAMSELEARWKTAVEVLPDLAGIRQHLEKTAHRLAFAFVVVMLDSKKFQQRQEIAYELEKRFLEAHFGSNPEIIRFAKALIELGRRDAVRALNNYVDVLGSDLNPDLIIKKVTDEFGIDLYRTMQEKNKKFAELKKDVKLHGYLEGAKLIIQGSQLIVEEVGGGLFRGPNYNIYKIDISGGSKGECVLTQATPGKLIAWVQTNLC
jgi:curved DNA-binding protein CbpA